MGKGGSAPKPPQLGIPQPSKEEKELMRKQMLLVDQMIQQGDIAFGNSLADRDRAFQFLDQAVTNPRLSEEERRLVEGLTAAYQDRYTRAFTDIGNQEVFNRNRTDSLIGLINNGVLNSTTGSDILGRLEQQKLQTAGNIGAETALQRLLLEKEFLQGNRDQALSLFGALRSSNIENAQLAGQLGQNAFGSAGTLAGQMRQNRMDAFNVMSQNAQAQYQYNLGQFQQNQARRKNMFGSMSGLIGAGLGLGVAAMAGGGLTMMNGLTGAGLGGALGGGLGRSFF